MYKLYTDKPELFEAKVELSGASISKSFCRLVLESKEWNLTFDGNIKSNGKVSIPIKKLKAILPESTTGKIKLEVIAEDTFFTPWESDFKVFTDKKVTVEVVEKKAKKGTAVTVEVKSDNVVVHSNAETKETVRNYLQEYGTMLKQSGINISNISKRAKIIDKINEVFFKKFKMNKKQLSLFMEEMNGVIKKLPYEKN